MRTSRVDAAARRTGSLLMIVFACGQARVGTAAAGQRMALEV